MTRRLRRSLKRARLRTWRAVRTYPALVLTAIVLAAAAAGSLGAFQSSSEVQRAPVASRAKAAPLDAPDPYVTPADQPPHPATLVMTYYLVSTPEMVQQFNTMKDELRFREWLTKSAFEVLLVRTPEEEASAQQLIATARQYPLGSFVVEDLRDLGRP